jgi:hypothetical protein
MFHKHPTWLEDMHQAHLPQFTTETAASALTVRKTTAMACRRKAMEQEALSHQHMWPWKIIRRFLSHLDFTS